jgi:hypothetical protein|tara:strand:+ start:258 stop:485 length:228 start_codon:yes stop_codon:yes gene_type:complete
MRTINDATVMLTNTRNEQSVEAECDNFREGERFDAYIATNKIPMRWNGKVYVGNMHGMEFTSAGPTVHYVKEGRR